MTIATCLVALVLSRAGMLVHVVVQVPLSRSYMFLARRLNLYVEPLRWGQDLGAFVALRLLRCSSVLCAIKNDPTPPPWENT